MAFPPYGVTVPSLSNWQGSFGGLLIGEDTPYGIYKVEGWADTPVIKSGDMDRSRDQGELGGLDFMGGRDIIITGDAVSDGTSLQHALEAVGGLMGAQPAEQPLWLQLPNLPLLASMVRPRKNPTPIDIAYGSGLASKILGFHGGDPRLYAAPESAVATVPTPIAGVHFNISFPLAFGGGSSVSTLTLTNAGNWETRPVLVLTGPMTNPTIENATTGWSLSFVNPTETGYTLNAGDTLTIDTDLRTVVYVADGTSVGSPRVSWLVPGSIWPNPIAGIAGLAPGSNTIQFTTEDSGAVAGTLDVQFASAYLL
jgi:hypothetical protein